MKLKKVNEFKTILEASYDDKLALENVYQDFLNIELDCLDIDCTVCPFYSSPEDTEKYHGCLWNVITMAMQDYIKTIDRKRIKDESEE